MTYFTLLLLVKIVVTLLLVAVPFLLLPKHLLEKSTGSQHDNVLFFRLYGVAIVALLVGYASAIPSAQSGVFSWGIALMGLVSNTGAAALLFFLGKGKQSIVLALFFSFMAVFLVSAMIFPEIALSNVY